MFFQDFFYWKSFSETIEVIFHFVDSHFTKLLNMISSSATREPEASQIGWAQILTKLAQGRDLNRAEATWALEQIMLGGVENGIVVAFLTTLRRKGESLDELSGLIDAMLANCTKLDFGTRGVQVNDAVDIVGTGGDLIGTVNISSMAAILTAGAGVPVLKHGSRSASGKTGSAEMLEKLGIRLDLGAQDVIRVFAEIGLTFFFAPVFHPAMKHLAPIRKLMAVPTTFNFLGPLANPAQPLATSLGVSNIDVAPQIAAELAARGRTGLIFRGKDGLDELTTTQNNDIWQVSRGEVGRFELNAEDFGLSRATQDSLIGGDANFNAQITRDLFAGKTGGNLKEIRDIVIFNAAGAVVAYRMAHDQSLAEVDLNLRFSDAIGLVAKVLDSGAAEAKLESWVAATR